MLGPTAGGQSGQKVTKFEAAQSQSPDKIDEMSKMPYPGITVMAERDICGQKNSLIWPSGQRRVVGQIPSGQIWRRGVQTKNRFSGIRSFLLLPGGSYHDARAALKPQGGNDLVHTSDSLRRHRLNAVAPKANWKA